MAQRTASRGLPLIGVGGLLLALWVVARGQAGPAPPPAPEPAPAADPVTEVDEAQLERWFPPELLARIAEAKESDSGSTESELWREWLASEPSRPAAWRGRFRLALAEAARGEHQSALRLLHTLPRDRGELQEWSRLSEGEVLLALDRPDRALQRWAQLPLSGPLGRQALLLRAETLTQLGRAEDAILLLSTSGGSLEAQAPPSLLARHALALGRARAEVGEDAAAFEAYATAYRLDPRGHGASAVEPLEALKESLGKPRDQWLELRLGAAEELVRARLMEPALEQLDLLRVELEEVGDEALLCRLRLARGRALYRSKRRTEADTELQGNMECADPDVLAPSLYLRAKVASGADRPLQARTLYTAIADRSPSSSLADDALLLSASVALDAGAEEEAMADLRRAVDGFLDSDMGPEALFRLAWTTWERGDDEAARTLFEQLAERVAEAEHGHWHRAGRYFAARILESSNRPAAAARHEALVRDQPATWHALMAFQRLGQLDGERARTLQEDFRRLRSEFAGRADPPLRATRELLGSPAFRLALASYRLGLDAEALSLFEQLANEDGTPLHDRIFLAELMQRTGRYDLSHWPFRGLLDQGALGAPSAAEGRTWALAYPLAHHELIRQVAEGLSVPPLYFQALVREESAFRPAVISWAGAVGLSQLMWRTARGVARQHGIALERSQLVDPATNLRIGALYLDEVLKRWNGHPALALANYNAGGSAVRRWLEASGAGMELDRFVETIGYNETRGYVKRVLSTYQAYRLLYGTGDPLLTLPPRADPASARP
jgi:soluble lytic murein transglycosylase